MRDIPKLDSDNLLVGFDTSDDAAVYKINNEKAIIQTLDFFTPIVNDPYNFGKIAAANALSDIYAMGGKATLALNIVGFPNCLDKSILKEILRGGADKVVEAGAVLIGGHSIEDEEPKYGLSVTGEVSPEKIITNKDAKVGDILVLTKPLGSGILATALKADLLSKSQIENTIFNMQELNKIASEIMVKYKVSACTDVTGFGLLGHLYEMAKGSEVSMQINFDKLNIMPGVYENAEMGIIPAGAYENRSYIGDNVFFEKNIKEVQKDILFDPQTSGGLVIAIDPNDLNDFVDELDKNLKTKFSIIGKVKEKNDKYIYVK